MTDLFARPEIRGLVALLVLLLVGAELAPRTMSVSVWVAMMPFVAVLGFVALGQHLVIQQKGFDLSVAGSVSVAGVIVTALPGEGGLTTAQCILLALVVGTAAGGLGGLAITGLRASPIVATIGVNALLLGLALRVSRGTSATAPRSLIDFANSRVFGIPTIFLLLVAATVLTAFVLNQTSVGRRFVATGTSLRAARILAIPVNVYRTMTYAMAGLFFTMAGVMLAGYLNTPSVFSGNPYMLTSVAAFIVGGNTLGGDKRTSVLATIAGVIFLTYLDQVLVSLGFPQSAQSIIQAVIVFAGVALPEFAQRRRA
jgi:ribose/xylose/arabinose/galactoside ABC-type transport system permease subunit